MHNKERYIEFCMEEVNLPVFYQPWWLNSVSYEGLWDVLLFEKDGNILGVYPYFLKKKYGIFNILTMPPFTPFLGPYLKYSENAKSYDKINFEKDANFYFIKELSKVDKVIQFFNYDFSNWLPYYWKGYNQTTYYSYVIQNISDIDQVKSDFHSNKKQEINKALKTVTVKSDLGTADFYSFHEKCLAKQNQKISYTYPLFKKIVDLTLENESGKFIYASENDKICSALFFIWDKKSGYNLVTAIDPDFKKNGSLSLLIYEAIKYLSSITIKYDLEGSMKENYEFSYRQFGGLQQQYFCITKTNSRILRVFESVKSLIK